MQRIEAQDTKEIWGDWEAHLFNDEAPSKYFRALFSSTGFPRQYPFSMIADLKRVPQNPDHHPEGDVLEHTLQVVDFAATLKSESEDPRALMAAALLHDLGKIPATKLRNGRITAYDHDKEGEKLAREFLRRCVDDEEFITRVCALVRWHMQVLFVAHNLPFADIRGMLRSVNPHEIALLAYCDRLGRGPLSSSMVEKEKKNIQMFLTRCSAEKTALIQRKGSAIPERVNLH
jgi:putative nucleotidyltransferase with HDIG domain